MMPGESVNTGQVKKMALDCGFDVVRITSASDMPVERRRYLDWIESGNHAGMSWITTERAQKSSRPSSVMPDAQAVISVGMSYWAGQRPTPDGIHGRIARYAWGADYHHILTERLRQFIDRLTIGFGGTHVSFVDTGPMMDKAFAARAGLGWYGKNTNILTEQFGSYVLLGEVVTSLPLEVDLPLEKSCGSCRLCQVACPTGALNTAYRIDSRRCISYLTIEHRGSIPLELRPLMGDWVFGCDICQDVCPPTRRANFEAPEDRDAWVDEVRELISNEAQPSSPRNRPMAKTDSAPVNHPLYPAPLRKQVDLYWLLRLSQEEYAETFRGSAVKRAKVWMLRRNAAVALGNVGGPDALGPLASALTGDEHPLVRGHAAWAISAIALRTPALPYVSLLRTALLGEHDTSVCAEIVQALTLGGDASP